MMAANNGAALDFLVCRVHPRFPAVTFHAKIGSRDLAAGHPLILHCAETPPCNDGFVIVVKPVQCYTLKYTHTHTIVTLF